MNFGCANIQPKGWVNVDKDMFEPRNMDLADALAGLPYEDESFDYIVAHHSLQCEGFHEMPRLVAELKRVLKTGGVLRVSVPDIRKAFDALKREDRGWFPINKDDADSPDAAFTAYSNWYSTNRTQFTEGYIAELFTKGQWGAVIFVSYRSTSCPSKEIVALDAREPESLYFEAVK